MSAPRRSWWRRLLSEPAGVTGVVIVLALLAVAALATFWTPYDPQAADVAGRWAGPGPAHLLGTDATGRDILSILMAGSRTTVVVAAGAGVIATIVGLSLAALGALTHRWVRESVAVLVDMLVAFPVLLIAMMISAVWGGSLAVVVWSVGIGFGVNIARVSRPELRRVLHSDFVVAARASGLSGWQNLTRHLIPNVAPVFIVQLSWSMAVAVLAEAGLSYLGFGAPVTDPSWGVLLSQLQQYLTVYPLSVLWPGLAITATVLGFNLLGDGLRDATDPTLRTRSGSARRARTHLPEVVA